MDEISAFRGRHGHTPVLRASLGEIRHSYNRTRGIVNLEGSGGEEAGAGGARAPQELIKYFAAYTTHTWNSPDGAQRETGVPSILSSPIEMFPHKTREALRLRFRRNTVESVRTGARPHIMRVSREDVPRRLFE